MVVKGTVKNLPEDKPGGQKKRGRLRLGWMDEQASVMRPRPNLKCCSAKEEEDGNF